MTTEPIDGRQLMRELQPRQARASVALETALGIEQESYPSLFEDTTLFRFVKGIDLHHNTPELRFSELDQADPAGQYRMRVDGDIWYFERAKTANWATTSELLQIDRSNGRYTFGNDTALGAATIRLRSSGSIDLTTDDALLTLLGGLNAVNKYPAQIVLRGYDSTGAFALSTPIADGSSGLQRFGISGKVAQAQALFQNAYVQITHSTPEFRFYESDQTAPAGEYRMGSTGDNFVMARSGAANFANALGSASDFDFLEYNRTSTFLLLQANESNSWYVQLIAGVGATPGTNSSVYVQGHATAPSIDLRTGNAGGGSLVSRMIIRGGTGSPDIDVTDATLDMNGNIIKGASSIYGQGNSAIYLRGNRAVTDATAHRIIGLVLNPADDTEYQAFAAVPKAATPLFTFAGSDYVPTTSELDADHFYIGYTKATNTATLYMNEGGVIVSLALGVLA